MKQRDIDSMRIHLGELAEAQRQNWLGTMLLVGVIGFVALSVAIALVAN